MRIHFTQKRVGFAKFPHYSNRKGTWEKEMQQKKICILLISIPASDDQYIDIHLG